MARQIATAASGELRDDHWVNSNGVWRRSTLLEGQRTNDWTRSEELDNAAWTKSNATVSADATTAPDGESTADKVVEDDTAAGSLHRISRDAPSLTDDTDQAISGFAKAAERTEIRVSFTPKDGGTASVWFDLSAGTVGTTGAGLTARITELANGWYKWAVVGDSASGATQSKVRIALGSGGETVSYDGDGTSGLFLWGLQFEADEPFESSYIKTEGSTVTRSADSYYRDFTAPPQEMTVYLRFTELGGAHAGVNTRMLIVGDGGSPVLLVQVEDTANGYYGCRHSDGSVVATSKLAAQPSIGDLVELRAVLFADGEVQIHQSINEAAETSGSKSSTAVTLQAAWNAERLYILGNATLAASTHGWGGAHNVLVEAGQKTLSEMRSLAGVS